MESGVGVLARHYGVRVTETEGGATIVDVSMPSEVGHAENAVERPDTVRCKMVRFRGDRVLFSCLQDEAGALVRALDGGARVIQAAYRRHAGRGEPFLPVPPVPAVGLGAATVPPVPLDVVHAQHRAEEVELLLGQPQVRVLDEARLGV